MRRATIPVLFGSLLLALVGASAGRAQESIGCGDLLSRSIDAAGESDEFTFSGTTGDLVGVTLVQTSGDGGIAAQVFPPGSTQPIQPFFAANGQARFILSVTGTYVIQVVGEGFVGTGGYNLGLVCLRPPGAVTGTLACGSLLQDLTIDVAGEAEVFTFTGSEGDLVALTLVQTAGFAQGVAALVYPPAGGAQPLRPFFAANDQDRFVLPATGTYVVMVVGVGFVDTGTYNLGFECLRPAGAVVGTLACGSLLQDLTIDVAGEAEVFTFTGSEGDLVALTLVQTAGFAQGVAALVYPPAGGAQPLRPFFAANDQDRFVLPATGTYVVMVVGVGFVDTGTYNLGFECLRPAGAVVGTLACGSLLQDLTIDVAGEADVFTFLGRAGDEVLVTLVQTAGFDQGVAALVYPPPEGGDEPVQPFFPANGQARFTLPVAGTYVVEVVGAFFADTGTYNLGYEVIPICPPDGECGNGSLDGVEQCDLGPGNGTLGGCCSISCTFQPAGTSCRPGAGACDVAESCSGAAATCPADTFLPESTPCRPGAGACDVAESCSGAGPACPVNGFRASGFLCRDALGVCDVAEACTGDGPVCPPNGLRPAGTSCRAAAGGCDVVEVCSGTSTACPADTIRPPGFLCRPRAGLCDAREVCTGTVECPADVFRASGAVCRTAAGFCDPEERCPGTGAACPADAAQPDGLPCEDGDLCTAGDRCEAGVCSGEACLVSDLCPARTIHVDFDDVVAPCLFANAEPLTDQLADRGLEWQGHGAVLDECAQFDVDALSSPNAVRYSNRAWFPDQSPTRTDDAMELLCPVDNVAFSVAAERQSVVQVRVFDASGAVLDEVSLPVGPEGTQAGFTGARIARVEYDALEDGDDSPLRFVLDDVEIGLVPEPGDSLLRVAALLVLAWLAGRRRSERGRAT